MKCNKCGAEVPDDAKFCIKCGNNLEEQRAEAVKEAPGDPAVVETAEAPEAEAPEAETPEKEAPETEGSEVKAPETADQAEDKEGKSEEVPEPDATETADEEAAPESGSEKAPAFTCPHCGAEIHPGDKFCTKCGATLVAPEPPMGQPAQSAAQQPVQQPPVQPPVQQPPVQQVPYQQPVQQPYYGQPQYQQPVQYPPQYAQPQQPQYPPQYAQPQQPAPEKPKHGKTPFWVWIIVGVLAAALIFCIIWFFVVPNVGNSGNSGAAQSGQAADSGPSRVYIDSSSDYAEEAEEELKSSAIDTIRETTNSWRNQDLLGSINAVDTKWDGNSLVVVVQVNIDYVAARIGFSGTYYRWYYTYVRYNNVYREDGEYHYEDSTRPHGKILNLYTDYSGDHHYVAGYSTEDEALSSAGV